MLTLSSPSKQNTNQTTNTITSNNSAMMDNISINEFIDLLWCYYKHTNMDNGLVMSPSIGKRIQEKDIKEEYCHVEFPEDRPNLCHVYRIKEWRDSVEKFYKMKYKSEFERRDKDYKMDCCIKIVEQLKQHPLASMLELEQLKVIAHNIVYKNRSDIAEKFGINELVYKGEIKI